MNGLEQRILENRHNNIYTCIKGNWNNINIQRGIIYEL